MAKRPSKSNYNLQRYAEISNPLAGKSMSKNNDSDGEEDDEEDPFGLGAIMATDEKQSDVVVTGGLSREGSAKPVVGEEKEEAEGEEEDPFGLGVIMASSVNDGDNPSSRSGNGKPLAGGKRAGEDPSPPDSKATKSQKNSISSSNITGSYFAEPHVAGRAPTTTSIRRPFLPTKRFEGARPGYVFQLGKSGLGYYVDKTSAHAHAEKQAKVSAAAAAGDSGSRGGRGATGREERQQRQTRPVVDVTAAAQKLAPLLLKPKKAGKAAALLADLMRAEMRAENARLFYRTLRPLAEQPASEAALGSGEGAAKAFRMLLERQDWVGGGAAEGVRMVTWELLFGLRYEVKTDDSFQFARAIKRLRSAIEALGDSTGGGGGSGGDGDGDGPEADAAEERSSALSHERKVAVIEIMKEAFKSYHLAWARSSIEPAFKAAADRRRLFPEGELRDALDGFTDAITKRQRNPGGLMAPPTRTVRAHNSIAHPTRNKRTDIVR